MRFYKKIELESMANEINKKYYPERLEKVIPLDVYALLEKIGCEIEWEYLSPNLDVMGMVFFENGVWPVWDDIDISKKKVHFKKFPKGTIVINRLLIDKDFLQKERFTVNHETMHWIKDRDFFKNIDNGILNIANGENGYKTYWYSSMSDEEIVERQTNYLNAAVLMPKEVIKKEFFRLLRFKNIPENPIEYKKYMIRAVNQLAKEFGLNFNPVLYRLYDLEILKRETH